MPSALRQRQRQYTVEMIIDAFCELTVNKPHFTMQDLADTAGISIRTLYRYYRSREALIAGLVDVITEKMVHLPLSDEDAMHEGRESPVRKSFTVFGEHDKLMRAVVLSRLSGALVDPGHTTRTEALRDSVSHALADQPEVVQRQVTGLLRLLTGSVAWMTMTDEELGLTSDEAGGAAAWAMRLIMEAARTAEDMLE